MDQETDDPFYNDAEIELEGILNTLRSFNLNFEWRGADIASETDTIPDGAIIDGEPPWSDSSCRYLDGTINGLRYTLRFEPAPDGYNSAGSVLYCYRADEDRVRFKLDIYNKHTVDALIDAIDFTARPYTARKLLDLLKQHTYNASTVRSKYRYGNDDIILRVNSKVYRLVLQSNRLDTRITNLGNQSLVIFEEIIEDKHVVLKYLKRTSPLNDTSILTFLKDLHPTHISLKEVQTILKTTYYAELQWDSQVLRIVSPYYLQIDNYKIYMSYDTDDQQQSIRLQTKRGELSTNKSLQQQTRKGELIEKIASLDEAVTIISNLHPTPRESSEDQPDFYLDTQLWHAISRVADRLCEMHGTL
jgi:hypothetical protein